ncbi:hypothetical protein Ddc_05792 [Ditylenchus destructor]|nr:hypothetical protein Ddc_05792 [Ditylenchus destructor]
MRCCSKGTCPHTNLSSKAAGKNKTDLLWKEGQKRLKGRPPIYRQWFKLALSVPTRGLRPLERWLCQCQLAAFGRSNGGFVSANSRPSAARTQEKDEKRREFKP